MQLEHRRNTRQWVTKWRLSITTYLSQQKEVSPDVRVDTQPVPLVRFAARRHTELTFGDSEGSGISPLIAFFRCRIGADSLRTA